MAEITDAQIDAAAERGRILQATEPRATVARYDRQLGQIVVDLTSGCTFSFPPQIVQGLETATDDELSQVQARGTGYGLHWEVLDVDVTVPGLLAGIFGTAAYMARRAGQATSPAKAAAARANGTKGGRPRKDEQTLPLVEESLVVGKREVGRGGVRVYSYVVETSVSEQVRLNEEAVAYKSSRVVEEVVVHKDVENRTETVSDTVRRTGVEVDHDPEDYNEISQAISVVRTS